MKKLFLSLVAAIVATTATYAQSSLIATLTHEGTMTTYYGTSAFSDAHTAAVDGDIITLSSGSFTAVNITKAVTIRGAGMAIDPTTQSEPTILTGDFNISMSQGTTSRLTIEGVYCNGEATINANLTGATFLKSRFKKLSSGNYKVENLTMIHCKMAEGLRMDCKGSNFSCLNSIVWKPYYYNGDVTGEFINCVVYTDGPSNLSYNTFKNCVLLCLNGTFPSSSTLFNNVGLNTENYSIFGNVSNNTNSKLSDYSAIFKTCTDNTYSDSETFELTDNAATTYKGTDGTQIGIYGGFMPFDPRPSNPRITNAVVGTKSDANGKLSINVTVQGVQ